MDLSIPNDPQIIEARLTDFYTETIELSKEATTASERLRAAYELAQLNKHERMMAFIGEKTVREVMAVRQAELDSEREQIANLQKRDGLTEEQALQLTENLMRDDYYAALRMFRALGGTALSEEEIVAETSDIQSSAVAPTIQKPRRATRMRQSGSATNITIPKNYNQIVEGSDEEDANSLPAASPIPATRDTEVKLSNPEIQPEATIYNFELTDDAIYLVDKAGISRKMPNSKDEIKELKYKMLLVLEKYVVTDEALKPKELWGILFPGINFEDGRLNLLNKWLLTCRELVGDDAEPILEWNNKRGKGSLYTLNRRVLLDVADKRTPPVSTEGTVPAPAADKPIAVEPDSPKSQSVSVEANKVAWRKSLRHDVGRLITVLEEKGLMGEPVVKAITLRTKARGSFSDKFVSRENLLAAHQAKVIDLPKNGVNYDGDLPINAAIAAHLLGSHQELLGKGKPHQKEAVALIREAVNRYYLNLENRRV